MLDKFPLCVQLEVQLASAHTHMQQEQLDKEQLVGLLSS